MRFLGRWMSTSLSIALALAAAVLFMQAPAFTGAYAAGLLQAAREGQQDIAQREDAARRYYAIAGTDEKDIVAVLRLREPSNAETLASAIGRAGTLQGAYDRIARSPPLLQPLTALRDLAGAGRTEKAAIVRTVLDTYQVQLVLTVAAALYGLVGLLVGSFLAELLLALGSALAGRSRRRATI